MTRAEERLGRGKGGLGAEKVLRATGNRPPRPLNSSSAERTSARTLPRPSPALTRGPANGPIAHRGNPTALPGLRALPAPAAAAASHPLPWPLLPYSCALSSSPSGRRREGGID